MVIGDRIASRMREAGLSQAELARRVGVSQPTIFKLIHSNKKGSTHMHVIARELGTTPAYLMGETDDPDSELPDYGLTAEEEEALALMRGLVPDDRKAVLQLIRSLATSAQSPAVHSPARLYRARNGTDG